MIPIAPAIKNYTAPITLDFKKTKRRRAKRSCDYCRRKKTRCDGDTNHPCSKCRVANVNCLFLTERKKRGPAGGSYVELLENRLKRMESLLVNLNKKKGDGKTVEIDDYDITSNQEEDEEYEEYEEEEEERSGNNEDGSKRIQHKHLQDIEYPGQNACEQLFQKSPDMDAVEQQMSGLTIKDYQRTRYFGASAGIHLLEKNVLFRNKKLHFKREPSWFIQKVNDDEEEHVIVKSEEVYQPQQTNVVKGPLPTRIKLFEDVPLMTPELLDLFVYLYFTQVHIYGPLINKVEFLEQYYFQNPSAPDEYLLYAIAYIGSQLFTPKESEMAKSDMTRIQECLKDKAFQILGIVYKRPYVSTVQSLLVLTSHVINDQEVDDEDTGHWIIAGLAIRLAQDLGLHIDCSQWKIPPYEIELRRRIWYTCYFVDRWIGAQLGRPLSIIDDDFDVVLPTPYELETKVARTRSEITPILLVEADSALQQRLPVYNHFSYLVTLTHILGQVLIGQYSTLNKRNRSVEFVNCMEQNLHMWRQSLPKEMFSVHDKHHAPQYSLMQLAYYTVIIFIYRPFISTTAENKELAFKALGICTSAANSLMNAALSVDNCSLANAPWNLAVYCLFQAAIIFLHNIRGENECLKAQGRENLDRCMEMYRKDPRLCRTRTMRILASVATSYQVSIFEACTESFSHQSGSPESESPTQQELIMVTPSSNSSPDIEYQSNVPQSLASIVCNPAFNSTRPEDMWNFSLSTVDMRKSNMMDKPKTPESYQQNDDEMKSSIRTMENIHQPEGPGDRYPNIESQQLISENMNTDELNHLFTMTDNLVQQQLDISSLKSDIPLWDVPSATTWNEWEMFIKHNMS